MKNKLILIALLFTAGSALAQFDNDGAPTQNVSRVTFLSPGLSFEKSIGLTQTVLLHAFISPSYEFSKSDALGTQSRFYLDPTFDLYYRYYYNAPRRSDAGKITTLNNMNYFAALGEVIFSKRPLGGSYESAEVRLLKKVGVVWGLQRNFPSRFSLDFCFGPGLMFGEATYMDEVGNYYKKNVSRFTPVAQLTLGLWLNRRY